MPSFSNDLKKAKYKISGQTGKQWQSLIERELTEKTQSASIYNFDFGLSAIEKVKSQIDYRKGQLEKMQEANPQNKQLAQRLEVLNRWSIYLHYAYKGFKDHVNETEKARQLIRENKLLHQEITRLEFLLMQNQAQTQGILNEHIDFLTTSYYKKLVKK